MRQLRRQSRKLVEDPEKIKLETKLRQSADKLETELRTQPKTKLRQSADKLQEKKSLAIKSADKLETELRTQPKTNLRQSADKLETNLDFSSLVGLQRRLSIIVYKSIRRNQSELSERLSIEFLALSSESTISSVRKSIQRLEKRGFINREKYKNGRGGWTIYSITKTVFQDLLQMETEDKLETKLRQTKDKLETELRTELRTSSSSSSSESFSNKETTITSENIMPEDWAKIKIPKSLIELGFSPTHIKQIYLSRRGSLQADEIQSSLHDFEYDMINGHAKPYKGAVNLFLSVLRSKGLPWVSSALAASEALEVDKQLKAIELKKETFEKKKLLESSAKVDLILKDLSDDEKKKILAPDGKLKAFGSFTYEMSLKGRIHEILEESGEEYFQKQQGVSL